MSDKLPPTLNIDAAALQPLTKRDMLQQLLRAKAESDRRNYGAKTTILNNLMKTNQDEFVIDSEQNGIAGLTHEPLNFKIHIPMDELASRNELRRKMRKEAAEAQGGWNVYEELENLIDSHGDKILLLKAASLRIPDSNEFCANLWYSPEYDQLLAAGDCSAAGFDTLKDKLGSHVSSTKRIDEYYPPDFCEAPWTLIKKAQSPILKGVTDAWGLTEGPASKLYGGPRPISSMLVGSLAGAGLGYLGGSVVEGLTDRLEKGRLRKTLAILGAGLGAAPGAIWGASNMHEFGPRGLLSDSNNKIDWTFPGYNFPKKSAAMLLPDCLPTPEFIKAGQMFAAVDPAVLGKPIPTDDFGRVIWSINDRETPFATRAAAVGLLDAASMQSGHSSIISPADVARVAMGMGSGYMSGLFVGKTLGALAGLKPETQKTLQQAGTWAGMLNTVVPMAFGSSGSSF